MPFVAPDIQLSGIAPELTLVTAALVLLIGSAAFAVDAGSLWSSHRRLRTTTDAASLAAAQDYAQAGNGCAGIDDTYTAATGLWNCQTSVDQQYASNCGAAPSGN
jgi:uncharacterized membrane protein